METKQGCPTAQSGKASRNSFCATVNGNEIAASRPSTCTVSFIITAEYFDANDIEYKTLFCQANMAVLWCPRRFWVIFIQSGFRIDGFRQGLTQLCVASSTEFAFSFGRAVHRLRHSLTVGCERR